MRQSELNSLIVHNTQLCGIDLFDQIHMETRLCTFHDLLLCMQVSCITTEVSVMLMKICEVAYGYD